MFVAILLGNSSTIFVGRSLPSTATSFCWGLLSKHNGREGKSKWKMVDLKVLSFCLGIHISWELSPHLAPQAVNSLFMEIRLLYNALQYILETKGGVSQRDFKTNLAEIKYTHK